ncbi:MAG: AsmA-like C-terminal region-containing protein [Bacteroidales bacterium]
MSFSGRRALAVVFGAVLIVLLALFLVVRWALDPNTFKPIAEARLSAALGRPVTIGAVRLSFLPALSVEGSDITVGGTPQAPGVWLDVSTVRLHPRLSTIFRRPVIIDRVEVHGLALNGRRDSAGRLLLPLPETGGYSPASTSSDAAAFDVGEVLLSDGRFTIADARAGKGAVTILDGITAAVQHTDPGMRLERLSASVGRSRVTGSGAYGPDGFRLRLAWLNLSPGDLPPVFALLGTTPPPGLAVEGKTPLTLDLTVDASGRMSASGRVRADRASLGTVTMSNFDAPLRFAADRLTLDPMAFRAYAGRGSGRVVLNAGATPPTWTLDCDLQHVDIDRFLSENTSAKGKVSGTAALETQLRGTVAAPMTRSMFGNARVNVSDGAVHDFPVLAALYSALRLGGRADRDLRFQSLTGSFAVAGERATTSDLTIRTGELTLAMAGTIGFDQAIAMNGTARFSSSKSAEMTRSVKELSSLTNSAGEIEVPVRVSGALGAPQFSIDAWSLIRQGVERDLKKRIGDKLREIFKKK